MSFSPVTGNNPGENTKIIRTELKRACISMLSMQNFDVFSSIGLGPHGVPEIGDFQKAAAQGNYLQFLEQAFEWENLQYVLYPYFWSRKETWADRVGFQAPDPVFAEFVRSGAARVTLPARLGFSAEVIHFLEKGDPWKSGPVLEMVSEEYQDVVNEILEAEKTVGKETQQGDEWLTVVPTSLVQLKATSELPEWKFNTTLNIWEEVNEEEEDEPVSGESDGDLDQDNDGETDVD
jgi:hypothetical protein